MSRDLSNHPDRPTVGSIVQLTTAAPPRGIFAVARRIGCPECGGARHEGPCTEEGGFRCPKCGARSGGDWSQCRGACPMVMSPHFETECAEEHYRGPPAEYPVDADVIDLDARRQ